MLGGPASQWSWLKLYADDSSAGVWESGLVSRSVPMPSGSVYIALGHRLKDVVSLDLKVIQGGSRF